MLSYTELAVDLVEAEDYIAARLASGWPEDEPEQLAALRRGQDHIAREYNGRWAVDFDNDNAPDPVKLAIIEAALVEARAPGSLSPMVRAADAKTLTGVDSITWTPVPGPGGVEAMRPRLLHVEAMLAPLLHAKVTFLGRA